MEHVHPDNHEQDLPPIQKQRHLFYWCQRVLPAVYDDSLSYYELLCKVIEYLNNTITIVNANADSTDEIRKDVEALQDLVDELKEDMDGWKNGDYIEYYIDSLIKWIDKNLIDLVGRIVKFVSFGLSKDGYFEAYIPLTWRFLRFDTIMDCNNPNYGCLVLEW